MSKPVISSFTQMGELIVQKYERYLPTSFDESLSLLEKVNKVIEYLNQIGLLTNDVVKQWNDVMKWIMDDGLSEAVKAKLDEMVLDGTLHTIINEEIFSELHNHKTAWINVVSLGADPSGLTDSSIYFQEAIDSLLNGGIVYIPEGTYLVNNIVLKKGISFRGDGNNATFLKRSSNVPMFKGSGVYESSGSPSLYGISFKDLNMQSYNVSFTETLFEIKTGSNFIFENVVFAGEKCTLLDIYALWDSRFINVQFSGGGNAALQKPAFQINGETGTLKQSKEIDFVNLWFESYEYCGIQTKYDPGKIKPQYLLFNNVKMESFYSYDKHVDITCNSLYFHQFYINSAYVSTHPVTISDSYGVFGEMQLMVNNGNLANIEGLIKLQGCYDVDLTIYAPTPLPVIKNIVTMDNPEEKRNNVEIVGSVQTINGKNTKTKYMYNSKVVQQVTSDTSELVYTFYKQGRPYWEFGRPSLINNHEEFYIQANGKSFITFRGLNGSFDDGNRQVRFNSHMNLDSNWDGKGLLSLGSYYFWIDSKQLLRKKSSKPTSDTDGQIVGKEVVYDITVNPDFIGQIAVVNGVGYMAVGTSSPTYWKQITV